MTVNRKFTKCLLVMALILAAVFPASAFAATGDVISIEIEGSSSGLELTIGKTTKQLKVWGTVEGSSTKRDVTGVVDWTSSNPEVVKVLNGVVTPLQSGSAVIKAVYNGSAVSTIEVKAIDTYKELKLEYLQSGNYVLGDDEASLKATAIAIIDNATGSNKDVTKDATWSSSNSAVLTVDKGIIKLLGEGSATITVKYAGLTATFEAKVTSPYSKLKLFQGTSSEPAKDIELLVDDTDVQLKALSTLVSDQSTLDVTDKATWTSSDTAVATVENGKLKVLSSGKTTITAAYHGVKAQVDVYVRSPFEAILLDPSSDQIMFIGEKINATAEMRSHANANEQVTASAEWSSSNQMAATVSSGEITAKAVGSSNIKVNHLGISKSFKITVYPTITKWVVEKTKLEMFKGETLAYPKVKATKLDGEETDFSKEVVWTSSNEEVAKVEDGKIVAKGSGTVTLTAKLPDSKVVDSTKQSIRGESVSVEITVKEKVLALITPVEKMNIVLGEETALPEVTAVWEDGGEAVVTSDVEWTLSGSNAVIKSGASGKVIKGLTKGSATLKGTYSNKTITIPVSIEQKITKIVVDPSAIELNIKKSKAIKVTGYYTDGTKVVLSSKVGWKSSNDEIATVTSTSVKAIAEGTATLSGSYQGHSVSVKVNVVPKLTSLTVNEKKLALAPGASKTLVLTAAYDTGKTSSVASSAVWTSSKPSVATVTDGKIVAVAKGSTSIKAKFGGKTVTIRVTVK
ncbi:Ig-like domain (group 2) [Fontibacillus panacisegetis]|uniref:Ig-like domain (Group 2) n=1 Tax=Fontibacillus panacisegetis TaxID=670482 RepID=A0A1G7HUF1_9BACL|nr:Ig-like domain-containing protein [Fontibacillus panacisegetis]SDF03854.1 Ig-like domain (group 2) [Fontibacillus panacisegetis]